MAQLSANPIKVASGDSLPVIVFKNSAKIRHIEFGGYAADADTAIIRDANGNDIALMNGATDLETVRTGNIGYVTGLTVVTCTSGEVTIYFE